jgi:glycosyltransferase involved in cell wall biosynthesis
MKILHLNTSDINGGAARAAYRLHRSLLNQDVESRMLVQDKSSDDWTVIGPFSKIGKGFARIRSTVDQLPVKIYPRTKQILFSPSWLPFSGIIQKIRDINPDIVHLHWIAGGFIRIEDVARIQKPIVWSLHDMWAFTGGCHYDERCERYTNFCGACPVLGSSQERDLSRWIFRRKQKSFSKIKNLTINGLSRWLADCAKKSPLLQNHTVVNLPNPIDAEAYTPIPKEQAKNLLGLSLQKKHILFGAMNAASDERKGFAELIHSLDHIQSRDVELAVFGCSEPKDGQALPLPIRYLGHLQDDISLRVLYSAADVMVAPSKQENLSNTIMESMACGTPVVGFDIGGNGDMVEHQMNGYLARPFDPIDLARGIDFCLSHPEPNKIGTNARDKIVHNFESQLVARQYVSLYDSILSDNK